MNINSGEQFLLTGNEPIPSVASMGYCSSKGSCFRNHSVSPLKTSHCESDRGDHELSRSHCILKKVRYNNTGYLES